MPPRRAIARDPGSAFHIAEDTGIVYENPNANGRPYKRRRFATRESEVDDDRPTPDTGNTDDHGHEHAAQKIARTRLRRRISEEPAASPARSLRARNPSTPATTRRGRGGMHHSRRFTSAGAAALATSQDGYKPREERGWEEFHPDLHIDINLAVFNAEDVDGYTKQTDVGGESGRDGSAGTGITTPNDVDMPSPRRPLRRRQEPRRVPLPAPIFPKVVPLVGSTSDEKLTLPKPQFMRKDPFEAFESKGVGQQNYVDRTMAGVGYQEGDLFIRHERGYIRQTEGAAEEDFDLDACTSEGNPNAAIGGAGVGRVEYDMDEQDEKWLEEYNLQRRAEQYEPIKPAIFEVTMTKIEKEWYALEKRIPKPNPKPPQTQRPRSSSAAAVNGEQEGNDEPDTKCAVCDDGDCENANAIVFCDGCDLAVHQECYGVPFIPEGQWLCRKCQLVGPGSPTCVFCPNSEGAFKQTNTSKWAHLLCAIWIPEISLGNPSLMEPIIDVEKIPRGRWKLTCYICKQRTGACIQCANKNCFVAFHITCARRAQLYTKMKLNPGAPAVTDPQCLKAFCDKHVPEDWRQSRGTDEAVVEAMEYYRTTMAGRKWPDSQAVALSLGPDGEEELESIENTQSSQAPRLTLTVGGNKRKRALPRTVWKLPSGAPVIPQIILNSVIASLGRFTVRQRKQYAEDACKYWTLKREARRGAALLKRLHLQLETFSSMEMTRRNFAGMGVAGAVRLQRRMAFADHLYTDVDKVRMLCDEVKKRERDKLKDVEMLRTIVDMVYFPLMELMWPIFEKAVGLDSKTRYFTLGLLRIRDKLESRAYGSVSEFSWDLANMFTEQLGIGSVVDTTQLLAQMEGRPTQMDLEVREKRKLAKRITKAIQPGLEDALKKESELNGRPFEKELEKMDAMFFGNLLEGRGSVASVEERTEERDKKPAINNDAASEHPSQAETERADPTTEDIKPKDMGQNTEDIVMDKEAEAPVSHDKGVAVRETHTNAVTPQQDTTSTDLASTNVVSEDQHVQASTEAPTFDSHNNPLSNGGVMWYMQPFDPIGTTIHEERWTGREVLRAMSEELSDFDEEEIREFIEDELEGKNELSTKQARDSHGRFKSKASLARAAAAAAVAANAQSTTAVTAGEGNGPEERKVYRTRKRKAYY